MIKSDLRARPVVDHEREAIDAHLTVVFASLAVSRYLQNRSETSIKRLVQTLQTARSATIDLNGRCLTLDPELPTPPGPCSVDSKTVTNRWREPGLVSIHECPRPLERPASN
jgi:hypothetical protein